MVSVNSVTVVPVGGYDELADYSAGLPNTRTTNFGTFTFAMWAPGAVTSVTLASYDTVVLNMASNAMGCNANMLSSSAKVAINAFVANGYKVIIQDAECIFSGAVDYKWLTFPFTTSNPGAWGFRWHSHHCGSRWYRNIDCKYEIHRYKCRMLRNTLMFPNISRLYPVYYFEKEELKNVYSTS